MPNYAGEAEFRIAREILVNSKKKWWCVLCCRPRRRNYCPATSRTTAARHPLKLRVTIPLSVQVEAYAKRTGEIVEDESDDQG